MPGYFGRKRIYIDGFIPGKFDHKRIYTYIDRFMPRHFGFMSGPFGPLAHLYRWVYARAFRLKPIYIDAFMPGHFGYRPGPF